jgi:myo-inositol 2-dehydrogenase/D-chiro-inositol 1-dehydrogenase
MIGLGNRGSLLLKNVLAEPRAQVVALCDIKPDRLDRAATAAAAQHPATTSNYRRLLERKDVEAVFIATPCDLHAEMAIAALAAGKHVYCEKPLATTADGVRDLLGAVRAAHTVFMVGLQRHSDPGLREVITKLHQGVAGKILFIQAQRHAANDFSPAGSSADWIFDAKRSGDVIVEQAIHNLDQCNWAVRSRPERAAGFGGALLSPNNPPGRTITDGYAVDFDYQNGVKMSFTQIAFHPREMPFGGEQTYIFGSEGAVVLETGMFYPRNQGSKPILLADRKRENREAIHIGKFYDCIFNQTKPETDVTMGAIATLTAILGRDAMYRRKVLEWKELGVDI